MQVSQGFCRLSACQEYFSLLAATVRDAKRQACWSKFSRLTERVRPTWLYNLSGGTASSAGGSGAGGGSNDSGGALAATDGFSGITLADGVT